MPPRSVRAMKTYRLQGEPSTANVLKAPPVLWTSTRLKKPGITGFPVFRGRARTSRNLSPDRAGPESPRRRQKTGSFPSNSSGPARLCLWHFSFLRGKITCTHFQLRSCNQYPPWASRSLAVNRGVTAVAYPRLVGRKLADLFRAHPAPLAFFSRGGFDLDLKPRKVHCLHGTGQVGRRFERNIRNNENGPEEIIFSPELIFESGWSARRTLASRGCPITLSRLAA